MSGIKDYLSLVKQRAASERGWMISPIVKIIVLEVKFQKQSSRNEIALIVSEGC